MADPRDPGGPLWWLLQLNALLDDRRPHIDKRDRYMEGRHNLEFAGVKFRQAFGDLFKEFADNWCPVVVDAVEERLTVTGFRIPNGAGSSSTEDPAAGDKDAWRMWQANGLDLEHQVAQHEALIHAEAYAIVWDNPDDDKTPLITTEHPSQVIVVADASNRRVRRAALKRWVDDDGTLLATVYLPDGIYKYRGGRSVTAVTTSTGLWVPDTAVVEGVIGGWQPREIDGEPWPVSNPLELVPVVPLTNRHRMLRPPMSEIHNVMPLQDAVNKFIADMIVASEFGAFRQRWATGLDVPKDPATGKAVEMFAAAVDRVWASKSKETKFGEFEQTDLKVFTEAVEMLVKHIATQSRTPQHYFYLSGQFPSGESIKSAETGLVAKTRRKQSGFGESWEEIIRLGFKVLDDKRGDVTDSETIWADPETRSESEHTDSLIKKKALGVPLEQLWEDAGYSPQQISRFKDMLVEQQKWLGLADLGAMFGTNDNKPTPPAPADGGGA